MKSLLKDIALLLVKIPLAYFFFRFFLGVLNHLVSLFRIPIHSITNFFAFIFVLPFIIMLAYVAASKLVILITEKYGSVT